MTDSTHHAFSHLTSLSGAWQGIERIADSPWTASGIAEGAFTLRPVAAGTALVQDYEQRRDGAVTLSGHGVFSLDPDSPRILWWWWDDIGHPPLAPSSGRLTEAGDLVFEKTTERGRRRDTFSGSGSRLVHRIEFAPAGTRELALFVDASYELRAPTGKSADTEARA